MDHDKKGSSGLYQVLILVLLWTLTFFQGSILAAIFCCTEYGESLVLLEGGVSAFHCGSSPGREQSFWWLGLLEITPFLRKAYYIILF